MILRKWEVRPLDKERAAAFAQTYGVPFFLAMLMNIRGLDDAAHLREFLGEGEPLSDPFLLKIWTKPRRVLPARWTTWKKSRFTGITMPTA